MRCPKCKREMKTHMSLKIRYPSSFTGLITKKEIRKKEVELMAIDCSNVKNVCENCSLRIQL